MRGSSRWLAEELLRFSEGTEGSRHTMESDVWAFRMTVYVSSPSCILLDVVHVAASGIVDP